MKWLYLSLLGLLTITLFPSSAQATCSGSGTTWSCTTGTTAAQVNTVISSASNNAIVTFAAGSYSWSGITLPLSNGITLICATPPLGIGAATVSPCTVSGGQVFQTGAFPNHNNLLRISGFTFNNSGGFLMWFCSNGGCTNSTMGKFRADHNTFNIASGGVAMFFGENSSSGIHVYGVIDHNILNSSGSAFIMEAVSNVIQTPTLSPLGTTNNLFIEDNTINITTLTNNGTGCTDGWGPVFAIVYRHNSSTNCRVLTHGAGDGGGPDNFEIYNNTITMNAGSAGSGVDDSYRSIHNQGGGTYTAFNNRLTPRVGTTGNPDAMVIQHFRDCPNSCNEGTPPPACDGTVVNAAYTPATGAPTIHFTDGNRAPTGTWTGYPCWHQPFRDESGNYKPGYFWNNQFTNNSTVVPLADNNNGSPLDSHMAANRDYFDAVSVNAQTTATSPFNGTIGMGFGTLANRPTTCTTSPTEAGGGVGYAAGTTSGTIGSASNGVASDYVVYTCSATNTWSTYYTPFTYPHPLVGPAGTPTVSLSPTSLSFGNQSIQITSSPQNITLTNTGTASLTITSITLTGANPTNYAISSNPCGGSLGAGLSCIIGVTFTPSAVGLRTANLTFTTDASSSPDNVPLTGTGQAPVASFSPTSATFNGIKVGLSSSPIAITLTNTGNSTMSITSITLTGANPSDYSSNTTCGATLTVSSSCAINVTFSPLLQGLRGANVSVVSNTVTSPDLVPLAGIGFNPISGTGTLSGTGTIKVQP